MPPGALGTTPEEMHQRIGTMLFIGNPEEIVARFKQRLAEVPLTGTINRGDHTTIRL
jgi:hypothetical protein